MTRTAQLTKLRSIATGARRMATHAQAEVPKTEAPPMMGMGRKQRAEGDVSTLAVAVVS